ncbi:MAG: hypothetical protein GX113_07680 [Actinobacteria bacterium]|nr:hypothetical protein [Actinomycetota bacterium]
MQINSPSVAVAGPRVSRRRRRSRVTGRIVWSGLLRILQRITHYKRGDRLEFKLGFSVRDLLTDKGRVVRDQVEALVQAVQKAGSYQAKEEAARAVHAVMDGLRDRVPADVFVKLSESTPVRETARLGRAVAQRLQKDDDQTEDRSSREAASV